MCVGRRGGRAWWKEARLWRWLGRVWRGRWWGEWVVGRRVERVAGQWRTEVDERGFLKGKRWVLQVEMLIDHQRYLPLEDHLEKAMMVGLLRVSEEGKIASRTRASGDCASMIGAEAPMYDVVSYKITMFAVRK